MFDFDSFSLFLALAGVSIGIALLVNTLAASDKIQMNCRDV